MPSSLRAREGKLSVQEMKAQLETLRKPTAKMMEEVFKKYYDLCMAADPPMTQIDLCEPSINWKALLMSLPPPQNSSILGCGIRKVILKETDCVYEGIYRFHVERLDGSLEVFEWREAYDDPYHSYKDKSFRHDVDTALRAAVLPQLIEYKEMLAKDNQMEFYSSISGSALPWERAVVQHFPTTFESLVDAFLNEKQLRLEQVKLEHCAEHAYRIQDPELLERWRAFHRATAHYRIISTSEAMEEDHL
uniref:Uncharacterized protein n=1 Tax=Noctiluca scintillans TaxID=2966 RepID=A0A7S1EY02_NOCSC|mmetsp:Transcript_18567/g.49873  ORF Transcript_18567/g.49873 Transcript_18567/m.49873 type:complete len:248 (+) Transcript_18567:96-839(+)